MTKYIIKSCPCFVEGIAMKGNEAKKQTCNNHRIRELTYCADISDCLLKRIVEKAKNTSQYNFLSEDILRMLAIEECEE